MAKPFHWGIAAALMVACVGQVHAQDNAEYRLQGAVPFGRYPAMNGVPNIPGMREIVTKEYLSAKIDLDNDGYGESVLREQCNVPRCRTLVLQGERVLLAASLPMFLGTTRETAGKYRLLAEVDDRYEKILVDGRGKQLVYALSGDSAPQTAAAARPSAAAGPANAGAQVRELNGVRLGMTPDEARNALRAMGPVSEQAAGVAGLQGSDFIAQMQSTRERDAANVEQMSVYFSPPPNAPRVVSIHYYGAFDPPTQSAATTIDQLARTYGAPTNTSSGAVERQWWAWTSAGLAPRSSDITRCQNLNLTLAARGFEELIGPRSLLRDIEEFLKQTQAAECALVARADVRVVSPDRVTRLTREVVDIHAAQAAMTETAKAIRAQQPR